MDLDLFSCFPKFGQDSLEGSGGIKLSVCNNGGKRESKKLEEKGGRRPLFKGGHKCGHWRGEKEPSQPSRPRAGLLPGRAGLGSEQGSSQCAVGRPRPGHGPASNAGGREVTRARRPGPGRGPAWREREAGWPPEAPGPVPASVRPGLQVSPFFFLSIYLRNTIEPKTQ